MELTYTVPTIVNGQISSHDGDKMVIMRNNDLNNSGIKSSENLCNNMNIQRKEHQTVIIHDSHTRGCTAKVNTHFTDKFKVYG
jgi:hypothetical protein